MYSAPLLISERGKYYAAHILKTPGLSNRVKRDYTHDGQGSIYSALIGLNDKVMQQRDGGKGNVALLVLPATSPGERKKRKKKKKPSLKAFIQHTLGKFA